METKYILIENKIQNNSFQKTEIFNPVHTIRTSSVLRAWFDACECALMIHSGSLHWCCSEGGSRSEGERHQKATTQNEQSSYPVTYSKSGELVGVYTGQMSNVLSVQFMACNLLLVTGIPSVSIVWNNLRSIGISSSLKIL